MKTEIPLRGLSCTQGIVTTLFITRHKERGPMKTQLKTLATLALVSALSAGLAQTTASGTTSTSSTTHKKTATRKAPPPKKPSVESQIQ